MRYDAIIIGAGVAGLVSALKLSASGKKILVLERQPVPGGYATTFLRKGFIFESAIHCVNALAPQGEIRQFLEEYGVDRKVEFIPLKDFARIIYPDHDFTADFSREHLIAFLQNNFPHEKNGIEKLFSDLDGFYQQFDRFNNSKLPELINLLLAPFLYPAIISMSSGSASGVLDKYIGDQRLKGIIGDIWRFMGLAPSKLSAFYFFIVFRGYFYNPTAYVRGGFLQLFRAISDKIKENGSQVRFNTLVKKIIPHNKYSLSVLAVDGQEFEAKAVISNASAIQTMTQLLDHADLKDKYAHRLAVKEKSISAFQVYLGLKVPAKDLGMDHGLLSISTSYSHDENFNYCLLGDYDRCSLILTDHAQVDPSIVPYGKGSLLIITFDSFAHWSNLSRQEYQQKKAKVADKLIRRAEQYLPGLSKNIEVMDAATPKTMQRYTLSDDGAIYGFAQTVSESSINRLPQKTPVNGLFLAGAWTVPGGGVHGCFISGINAANLVLRYLK